MTEPTLKELAARVILLEEQVVSLTELFAEVEKQETERPEAEPAALEEQHLAFRARLKEKRRCG